MSHNIFAGARFYLAPIKVAFTVIMKHKEAAGAEVTVELDENLIGSGGNALLDRVPAELADLRRSLVGPIPEESEEGGDLLRIIPNYSPQVIT